MTNQKAERQEAATIYDVAQAAQVAPSTVSRAFSRPGRLNAATERRIREVADRLGYRPNLTARGLSTGRTRNIGMLAPDVANPFFAEFLRTFQRVAGEQGYGVLFIDTDENPSHEPEALRTLASQTDGVVLCCPRSSEKALAVHLDPMRTVVVNKQLDGVGGVVIDSEEAIRDALGRIQQLGHESIVYARGPSSADSDRVRRRVVRSACRQRGIEVTFTKAAKNEEALAAEAVALAVSREARLVVAHSDIAAVWIMHECHRQGILVPDDLSVVGHDNILLANMMTPPITTIDSRISDVATAAADALIRLVGDEGDTTVRDQRISVPAGFVDRGSLGPARPGQSAT